MKRVFKYPLTWTDYISLYLPTGAEVLTCGVQFGEPVLWALIDEDEEVQVLRTFRIAGTGHEIDEDVLDYVGMLKIEALIFHVFEVL